MVSKFIALATEAPCLIVGRPSKLGELASYIRVIRILLYYYIITGYIIILF